MTQIVMRCGVLLSMLVVSTALMGQERGDPNPFGAGDPYGMPQALDPRTVDDRASSAAPLPGTGGYGAPGRGGGGSAPSGSGVSMAETFFLFQELIEQPMDAVGGHGIGRDTRGRMTRIGNAEIRYDRAGRPVRVADYEIGYDSHGRVVRFGGQPVQRELSGRPIMVGQDRITYDSRGEVTFLGSARIDRDRNGRIVRVGDRGVTYDSEGRWIQYGDATLSYED
jgi:hypothetical protein